MKKYIKYIVLFLIILTGAVFGFNEYANNHIKVTEYTYKSEKVTKAFDGYKIMVISDIHNAPFEEDVLKITREEKPDVVIFSGDLVQLPDEKVTSVVKIAEGIGGEIPVYAVSGNHESLNESYDFIMEELEKCGVRVIDDKCEYIERDGEKILIAGLKDLGFDYITTQMYEKANATLKTFFEGKDELKILVNHRADMYENINEGGADIIVSGHLHGGVVRLPFAGGVIGKSESFFPEYDYGYYEGGEKSDMIVSGGCDKNKEKKRFFNPPEAVVITLKSE